MRNRKSRETQVTAGRKAALKTAQALKTELTEAQIKAEAFRNMTPEEAMIERIRARKEAEKVIAATPAPVRARTASTAGYRKVTPEQIVVITDKTFLGKGRISGTEAAEIAETMNMNENTCSFVSSRAQHLIDGVSAESFDSLTVYDEVINKRIAELRA